jgi:hypothetical protein
MVSLTAFRRQQKKSTSIGMMKLLPYSHALITSRATPSTIEKWQVEIISQLESTVPVFLPEKM